MSPKDIKIGKTYTNRGAGRTRRYVVDIVPYITLAHRGIYVTWGSFNERPSDPVVAYRPVTEDDTPLEYLYLRSFASWAGSEVPNA